MRLRPDTTPLGNPWETNSIRGQWVENVPIERGAGMVEFRVGSRTTKGTWRCPKAGAVQG